MRGLYVHVPFCVKKCAYCDFYSLPGRLDLGEAYIEAVLKEAETYRGMSFDTLYLGGGTPSLLEGAGLRRMLDGLRRAFDLANLTEATIEANPDSATPEVLEAALARGINRISLGVQSLSDAELSSVGRVHTSAQAVRAITRAREAGFRRLSADAIIGLPGQDWASLRATLEGLAGLGIDHLSLYLLSLEAGTPLATRPPEDLPSDEEQAELYERARSFLIAAGFIHYEISNFARPGQECRHNLNYWRGGEYLGLGPAAASHLAGRRYRNKASLEDYLRSPAGIVEEVEELAPAAKAAEEAMLRLRLLEEGADIAILEERFGAARTAEVQLRMAEMAGKGWLTVHGSRYRLTPARILTSNPVFAGVLG